MSDNAEKPVAEAAGREVILMPYARGDIYFVERMRSFGSEQWSGRPAIIVSSELNNRSNNVVEVVYLTTQPKRDMPTHIKIQATGTPSTALCEQVHSVDCRRLGRFIAKCSDQELRDIDFALLVSLGLNDDSEAKRCVLCGSYYKTR